LGRVIFEEAEVVLRKTLFLLAGFTFSFWSSFGRALNYSDLEVIFRASKTPQASNLVGIWLGRCAHQADPQRLWPAFFEFKQNSQNKGFSQYSQSHTWFNEQTDKYDSYTQKDIAKDPSCKTWLENEQWNPIYYEDFSLVNKFHFPNRTVKRSSRIYHDGISEHIIVAYSDLNSQNIYPASFCFFNVRVPEEKIND